jgi:cellulose synthase/poly-beta-1,6-N-acetylglucosamine synthase-like glycosyltransferase
VARGADASAPRVAVVVCSRDRPGMLRACLEALAGAMRPTDEAVVVDSASRTDATRRVAAAAGLPVVRCERPGLSRARNAGVRATAAPIVAFTDDDCLPRPGWTAALEAGFDDERVGFVCGRVEADVPGRLTIVTSPDAALRRFVRGDDPGPVCHGANMAFRRTALQDIRGFDEMLGAGTALRAGEDEDAFWRVLARGWTGRYVPTAAVVHRQWRGTWRAIRMELGYGIGMGAFAVKVARMEGAEGRRLLRRRLLDQGILEAGRHLRRGHETPAAVALAKALGVAVGAVRGLTLPLEDGRFAAQGRR